MGSPFTLNYASDRARGNAADRQLTFQLIDSVVPPSLVRVDLQIDVAGRRFGGSFLPSANLAFTFTWDGLDAYGRRLQASQPVVARVGYVYPIAYAVPASATQSFGLTFPPRTGQGRIGGSQPAGKRPVLRGPRQPASAEGGSQRDHHDHRPWAAAVPRTSSIRGTLAFGTC